MEWFFLALLLGGGSYATYKKLNAWSPPKEEDLPDLGWSTPYGQADWLKLPEYTDPGSPSTGIFLGQHKSEAWSLTVPEKDQKKWGKDIAYGGELGQRIYTLPESNTLLVAPAGSGKGRNIIINTLLEADKVSVFTIDPKGENCAVTVRERLKMGQKVHVLNPWGLFNIPSRSVNPLDLLQEGDPAIVSNATFLTDLIMMPSMEENFWDSSARTFIRGLLLYVALKEKPENRTLTRFFDILSYNDEQFKNFLPLMATTEGANGVIKSAANILIATSDRTSGDLLATARAHADFLNDPTIKRAMERSDFSFTDLKDHLTTIYVIIPPYEIETQGRWLRLMVGMAITAMQRGEPFKHRALFLLDEFAALGRLETIRQGVALHRGYGIDYCLVVQDLNQLQELYKNGWQTILSNCRFKHFKDIADNVTADYVCKLLGNKTVWSDSEKPQEQYQWWEKFKYVAGGRNKVGMPLRGTERLLTENPDTGYVIRVNGKPMLAQTCPYDQDDRNKPKADPNPYHTDNYQFPADALQQLREGRVSPPLPTPGQNM